MSGTEEKPAIAPQLKSELLGEHVLRKTETAEKVVLPTSDDVAAEKRQNALLEQISGFTPEKLQHVDTDEKNPLPTQETILAEKAQS